MIIRGAKMEDVLPLSELCFLSKAYWGYDDVFMACCKAELNFYPEDIGSTIIGIAIEDEKMLGVAQLIDNGERVELNKLFVHPLAMRRGVGVKLFRWAVDQYLLNYALLSQQNEETGFGIVADPFAKDFYLKQGARLIGHVLSETRENRWLPLFVYEPGSGA